VIGPFVDTSWLADHRDEVVLVDVRFYLDGRPGRPAFEAGHLPGAVYVELEDALSAHPEAGARQGRHPFPTAERFAAGLAAAGVGDGAAVVAYDDAGGIIAARLVWMLRAIGHQAALLDGGLTAWNGPVETGPSPPVAPAEFTPVPWPADRLAEIEEVAGTSAVLIDARDNARFHGGPDLVDPRSGHIPGARNVETRKHLLPDGRLQDGDALRARFAEAGIEEGTPVISYCGSGVSACHNLLIMEQAGLGLGRLYPGSWSEWSRDPSRPIET
jgi:thiosulfate/3-mercaptopyruvate sulfurtransferase